jgi:hypothetical protein
LYTPSSKDAPELKKIRDEQFLTISEWIEQYWYGGHNSPLKSIVKMNLVAEE